MTFCRVMVMVQRNNEIYLCRHINTVVPATYRSVCEKCCTLNIQPERPNPQTQIQINLGWHYLTVAFSPRHFARGPKWFLALISATLSTFNSTCITVLHHLMIGIDMFEFYYENYFDSVEI